MGTLPSEQDMGCNRSVIYGYSHGSDQFATSEDIPKLQGTVRCCGRCLVGLGPKLLSDHAP